MSDKFKGKSGHGLFGDVIMEIDWSVGQVFEALKRHGIDDNTLVVHLGQRPMAFLRRTRRQRRTAARRQGDLLGRRPPASRVSSAGREKSPPDRRRTSCR